MGYKTVALPEEIVNAIRHAISKHKDLGFKSVPEFVKDAIRRRLEQIERWEAESA